MTVFIKDYRIHKCLYNMVVIYCIFILLVEICRREREHYLEIFNVFYLAWFFNGFQCRWNLSIYILLCLSVYLATFLSFYLSILWNFCRQGNTSFYNFYTQAIYLYIYLYIYLSIYLSVYVSVFFYLSIFLSNLLSSRSHKCLYMYYIFLIILEY